MPPDKDGGYSATITPAADFTLPRRGRPRRQPAYAVETIQPVDLAADSPEITAKPPAYAEDTVEPTSPTAWWT